MPPAQSELTPRLLRLFAIAGLIGESDLSAYAKRNRRHIPLLEAITQEASFKSFKDLLNAEITFKKDAPLTVGLHEGLVSPSIVNDSDLEHLLRVLKTAAPEDPAPTTAQINAWLSDVNHPMIRDAALGLALQVLAENDLLGGEDEDKLAALLNEGLADELLHRLRAHGLEPARLAERIEAGLNLPQMRLTGLEPDRKLFDPFPQSLVRRQTFVPIRRDHGVINLATPDPFNLPLVALVRWATGLRPRMHFAPIRDVIDVINAAYGTQERTPAPPRPMPAPQAPGAAPAPAPSAPEREMIVDSSSAVSLVSSLIENAIEMRATDIHIEPSREGLNVRYRIDGELHRITAIPDMLAQPVVSRVKVLAEMDVTERRRPQDGHFELRLADRNFDFRISTLPAALGEKMVIRILDSAQVMTGMAELGLLPDQRQQFDAMLARAHGMILVTGPTGSGKTSTLYTGLQSLNSENRNLVTVEDPVEYQLAGINQVQVDPHIGLTFSEGLRSILRQDPDIIMVGEIRDPDTAKIAMRAAMTGHLVLSTLHTNTALGALDALTALGAQPFMIANALIGVLSQRLIRRLCPVCRKGQMLTEAINLMLALPPETRKRIHKPVGCPECFSSGYRGRTAVFEIIRNTARLRPLISQNNGYDGLLETAAREEGMASLQQIAVQKVLLGETSVDEIRRKILVDV